MVASILQLIGLALIITAGVVTSAAAAALAVGVVTLHVGLAVERD